MPSQLDEDIRAEIVRLRALDYDKTEIAEELGISRNTVTRQLQQVREEAEEAENPETVVVELIAGAALGAAAGIALAKLIESVQEDE